MIHLHRIARAALTLFALTLFSPAAPALAADTPDSGWRVATHVAPADAGDRVHGSATANLSVIIWLDPECPYCKTLGAMPQRVVDDLGTGVNLVVRLFPLPFHGQAAVQGSLASLCVGDQAGPDGYYRFLDGWLAATLGNGRGLPGASGHDDPLGLLAAQSGARDTSALVSCIGNQDTGRRLVQQMQAAEVAGVQGTPAIAIRDNRNGHTIMEDGAIAEADLRRAIAFLSSQGAD
ncbi:DsbA family protein [Novosphingobium sp.]|uniref:DsbA family protein n=1 Tax=Novosphingobium sp. TaxID=1874826 RepID=UPI0038BCD1AE